MCRNLGIAEFAGEELAVAPGQKREEIVPVAVGRFAITLVADGGRQQAVESRFRPMQRIRPGAEFLDESRCPHYRLENRFQERAIPGQTIGVGGDRDELALRIKLDVAAVPAVDGAVLVEDGRHHAVIVDPLRVPQDIGFRVLDQTGIQQRQRLRGAVAYPRAVVIARAGLERKARRVQQNQCRLRFDRIADLGIAHRDLAPAELRTPDPGDLVAQAGEVGLLARVDVVPHRCRRNEGNAGTRCQLERKLASGTEQARVGLQAAGGRVLFLVDQPRHVATVEVGNRDDSRFGRERRIGSLIDPEAPPVHRNVRDERMATVLPVRIDLHRAHREHERPRSRAVPAVRDPVLDQRFAVVGQRRRQHVHVPRGPGHARYGQHAFRQRLRDRG